MLIGICGKARSGKDTIANYLCDNYSFKKISFADPLKKMVMDLFDMTENQCYGDLKETIDERYGKTPRWLLQYIGTDVFRKLYPSIWVDKTIKDYKKYYKKYGLQSDCVIPDVRFINEFDAIKTAGGQVWKVIRNNFKDIESGIKGHSSETELESITNDKFDLVLNAPSGKVDKLYKQIENYF